MTLMIDLCPGKKMGGTVLVFCSSPKGSYLPQGWLVAKACLTGGGGRCEPTIWHFTLVSFGGTMN